MMISQAKQKHRQKGASMIEVLVTLVVVGIGILGMVGFQNTAVKHNHNALLETQAHFLANDILERMRSSKRPSFYLLDYNSTRVAAVDCMSENCDSPQKLSQWDLEDWLSQVRTSLPRGDAEIQLVDGINQEYAISIRYDDLRGANNPNEAERVMVVRARI